MRKGRERDVSTGNQRGDGVAAEHADGGKHISRDNVPGEGLVPGYFTIASHGRKGGREERAQSEAHPLYSLGRHLARPQRTCTQGLVHVHNASEKYVNRRGKSFGIVGGGASLDDEIELLHLILNLFVSCPLAAASRIPPAEWKASRGGCGHGHYRKVTRLPISHSPNFFGIFLSLNRPLPTFSAPP